MVQIKRLTKLTELQDMSELEQAVWRMPPVPLHHTYTVANNGGIILGAYMEEKLVGFLYSFPGVKGGVPHLCSHLLGIMPTHRNTGIGQRLKEAQRDYALQEGFRLITWTFDPLESRNSYLNLHILRGIAAVYYEDYYGEVDDSLNASLPTDRFLLEWWLSSEHVRQPVRPVLDSIEPLLVTELDRAGLPVIIGNSSLAWAQANWTNAHYAVPIPEDFQLIKRENASLAMEWRKCTRTVFKALLEAGYVGENVFRLPSEKICLYIFTRRVSLVLSSEGE